MLYFYLPIVLVIAYYSLYYYFTRTFNYWKKRNVVGPKPVPLFGNIMDSALRRSNMMGEYLQYYNMFPKEKVVGVYRMTTPCLLLRDLEVIKHIMIKDFDLFRDRGVDFSSKGLGQNMFHADGDTWSALRTRFSPIFTPRKLKNMFYLVNDCVDMLMVYLANTVGTNPEQEVGLLFQRYTVSSIFACAFGVQFNNFQTEVDTNLKKLDKMVFSSNFAFEMDMMYPGLLKKLNLSLFSTNVTKFFENLVQNIILQRNGKPSGRGDFMDLILQLREMGEIQNVNTAEGAEITTTEITNDMIAAQAFVFYVAGYETSSSTLAYLLYQLALNPEIQETLREEIDSVTKAHGLSHGVVTYESLKDMKYLDKVYLETLRMYPIVDPLHRKAGADYQIPDTDVVIKKNQTVLVSVLGIHHDKNYYPKPEVFDPHRFDPEVIASRHPCAYLPFGVGPRNCIGMRFGGLQTRLCAAKLISKFRVETSSNTKSSLTFDPNRILLAPEGGIHLNIKPRKL